jgi:hypothetical protein
MGSLKILECLQTRGSPRSCTEQKSSRALSRQSQVETELERSEKLVNQVNQVAKVSSTHPQENCFLTRDDRGQASGQNKNDGGSKAHGKGVTTKG